MSANNKCQYCPRVLKTNQGLKSHTTRLHKDEVPGHSQTIPKSVVFSPSLSASFQVEHNEIQKPIAERLSDIRTSTKILRRIPKGARTEVANALSSSIEKCIQDNSESSWERLLLFACNCLNVPTQSKDIQVSLTTLVKRNTIAYLDGGDKTSERVKTKPRVESKPEHNKRAKGDPKCEEKVGKLVEAKLSEGDIRGAIRIISNDETFISQDCGTFDILKSKHPSHEHQPNYPSETQASETAPLQVTDNNVKAAVASFPAGSAGGIDMLRPQHLKDMISHSAGNAGVRLVSSLTKLCNLMLRGEVPDNVCPVLYGASLCAFRKKDGGVRPIAVGCTIRRLVAKVGCYHISSDLGEKFLPHQMGFGIKCGAEAAAHAARRYLNSQHSQEKVFLKIDFSNAFNSVNRDSLLKAVCSYTPELYPFLRQCYEFPSHLFYGEKMISSSRGIQQGDPLGSALFSMVMLPAANSLVSEFNLWYLDDVTLADKPEIVLQDYNNLVDIAAEHGLQVNPKKCELFAVGSIEPSPQVQGMFTSTISGIKFPASEDCTLLGAPLTEQAIEGCLSSKTQALKLMSGRLTRIPAHCAYYLLKNSFALPKLTYILRCCPSWKFPNALEDIDEVLKVSLELITNTSLSFDAWEQASWPVSKGGLGIRRATKTSLPAFLASSHSALALVGVILSPSVSASPDMLVLEALDIWERQMKHSIPPNEEVFCQKSWENKVNTESIRRQNEQVSNLVNKARLVGVSASESGAFLNVLPSVSLGTRLDNEAFRIAIALRLGTDICEPHTCICGSAVDQSGTHALSCKKVSGRFFRHSAVNDIIRRALGSANIPSMLEPAHLEADSHRRPDGVTLVPWERGKTLVWDFTCTNSLATSYVETSAVEPLSAATNAEKNKKIKYANLESTHIVMPLAAECLGAFGRASLQFLQSLGRKIASASGEKQATAYLLQRISVAIQRGNAAAVLGTFPSGETMNEQLGKL